MGAGEKEKKGKAAGNAERGEAAVGFRTGVRVLWLITGLLGAAGRVAFITKIRNFSPTSAVLRVAGCLASQPYSQAMKCGCCLFVAAKSISPGGPSLL